MPVKISHKCTAMDVLIHFVSILPAFFFKVTPGWVSQLHKRTSIKIISMGIYGLDTRPVTQLTKHQGTESNPSKSITGLRASSLFESPTLIEECHILHASSLTPVPINDTAVAECKL